jgi:hypothetical protein
MGKRNEGKILRLKKKMGRKILYYDRFLDEMDCSENLAVYLSSYLGNLVLGILKDIEELKKLELEGNGQIPDALLKGENVWKAKLEI